MTKPNLLQKHVSKIQDIAICASGPSLLLDDCRKLTENGIPVIAVNSTWRAVPECAYIFACDLQWWNVNVHQLPDTPQRWSSSAQACSKYGINYFFPPYSGRCNSGQQAILFAEKLNARRIILLGYDCSIEHGSHWHGRHANLMNPTYKQVESWEKQFIELAGYLQGKVEVINCTRKTALNCFERASLKDTLKTTMLQY